MTGRDAYAEPGWKKAIEEVVREHRDVEGAVMPVLEAVQARFGYISEDALVLVAEGLHLTPPQVYAVATYYHGFRLGPQPAHRITLCRGPACRVGGGAAVRRRLEQALGVEVDQSTPDGQFALDSSGCLGICPNAPAIAVDDELVGRVEPDDVEAIVERTHPHPSPLPKGEGVGRMLPLPVGEGRGEGQPEVER